VHGGRLCHGGLADAISLLVMVGLGGVNICEPCNSSCFRVPSIWCCGVWETGSCCVPLSSGDVCEGI
jgi:hypothetical protein